jgi:hypothetical protein
MATKDCPCLLPDEHDNCVECGKHIDMPDVEAPNLGDITGIIRLIDNTAKSYAKLVEANSDPANPTQPKLRLVGGQFVRLPHNILCKSLLNVTYTQAKQLGYRGTFDRWGELVTESAPGSQPSL